MPDKAHRPDQESHAQTDPQHRPHEEDHDKSAAQRAHERQRAKFATHDKPAVGRVVGKEIVGGDETHWRLLVAAGFDQGVDDWFWASLDMGNGERRDLRAHTSDTNHNTCRIDVRGVTGELFSAHPMVILEPPKHLKRKP